MLFFICIVSKTWATHNRAGEIIYEHITGYTYKFTIVTYTTDISIDPDRDTLTINYGDGVIENLGRTTETPLGNNIKYNEYIGYHTYPGAFTYIVSMEDPNLVENIINIDFGESENTPFFLTDTLRILDPTFYGYNNSPKLLQAPIDYGNLGEIFIHNPNAYDPDGDSLSYELIVPLAGAGFTVPGYLFLDQVIPGPSNIVTLNSFTGELIWNTPQQVGIYSLEILIREYRFGIEIGNMIRHMQVIVENNDNEPPQITNILDTCIIAGDTLAMNFVATDPDIPDQIVSMTATGGPFEVSNSPATFDANNSYTASLNVEWITNCDHIRSFPYLMVIKAEDDYTNSEGELTPLVDLYTWQVNILAPPPQSVFATVLPNNTITISWLAPYSCADSPNFLRFAVWRKIGCNGLPDKCNNNPASLGYSLIGYTNSYSFNDPTAIVGQEYSYIVVAQFGTINAFGVTHNLVFSAISNQACVNLPFNVPVITNVSVTQTNATTGKMYIAWSKPRIPDFDTITNPGPYTYELYESQGKNLTSPFLIQSFTKPTFADANDTIFVRNNLNTVDFDYSYRVVLKSGSDSVGATSIASSIFLNTVPSDEKMILNWNENVPWKNDRYVVYRLNGIFWDSIGQTTSQTYTDKPLINGNTYCYHIKSVGKYTAGDLVNPILNLSQESCDSVYDNVPPCPPNISITNNCIDGNTVSNNESFINQLSWEGLSSICESQDLAKFHIWYKEPNNIEFLLVATINDPNATIYQHVLDSSLAGCYYLTAEDSVGNESISSNIVCVENCNGYLLPNTFTPNADGYNDFFKPIVNKFVSRIEMKIYDRWGVQIFETEEPAILWDGMYKNKPLPNATYFYTCKVYIQTNNGEKLIKELNSFIELFR